MRLWYFPLLMAAFLLSCKSTKTVSSGTVDDNLSVRSIIKNHYRNQINFNTLRGRLKIDYSDGYSEQSVGVSLRMKKDEAIWMSAPFGVLKAYITPDRVSFYNKLDNEYFDGDFSYLSALLGTELDFNKVQNLLLGQALLDLREDEYKAIVSGNNYELTPEETRDLFKILFQIEPRHYKIATQQLSQPLKKRLLNVKYTRYQEMEQKVIPEQIDITAIDTDQRTQIEIVYKNLEFNKALNFPYKIPEGYDEIVLE